MNLFNLSVITNNYIYRQKHELVREDKDYTSIYYILHAKIITICIYIIYMLARLYIIEEK